MKNKYGFEILAKGTKVRVDNLFWGESDKPLYNINLIGLEGEVIDHDDDCYTPPNVVYITKMDACYFLPNECLSITKE